MVLSLVIFALGAFGTAYVLVGYPAVLAVAAAVRRGLRRGLEPLAWPPARDDELPTISVLLPVRDEADVVVARLEDLARSDYPKDRLEIVVASDGSTDATVEEARRFAASRRDVRVRVEAFATNRGKHAIQNWFAAEALHDVLVFTDAETRFEPDTLRALCTPFRSPGIGVTGGHVRYRPRERESSFARLYARYRDLERTIRRLETRLGVGCKTDGSCTAARRAVWRELEPFEAEDQTLPLVARQAGLRTVHVDAARAVDRSNTRARQEFRQRRRMTRKAVRTFLHRWRWADAARHPDFTAAYVSHKLLRFLMPVFLLAALAGALTAAAVAGVPWWWLAVLVTVPLGASWALAKVPKVGRVLGLPYAFAVANAALLLGVWDACRGFAPSEYTPTRRLG